LVAEATSTVVFFSLSSSVKRGSAGRQLTLLPCALVGFLDGFS
jgi:hypothetical protein